MNTNKILYAFLFLIALNACTKEETIETKTTKEYVAPKLKIYGTWKNIATNGNNYSKDYMIIKESGFFHNLTASETGFKSNYKAAFHANESVFNMDGWPLVYEFAGDSLMLKSSANKIEYLLVPTTEAEANENTWLSSFTTLKQVVMNSSSQNYGFGVDGDILYINARPYSTYNIYKFDASSNIFLDSFAASTLGSNVSLFYKKNGDELFVARSTGIDFVKKTNGFSSTSTFSNASTNNNISSIRNISMNATSGTIFCYNSSRKLYTGTDGGNFTELTDLNNLAQTTSNLVYIGSDEFLCVYNSTIHKVKVSPTFQVVKSYNRDDNFNVSNVGTDGLNHWVYGYDNALDKYVYRKIQL